MRARWILVAMVGSADCGSVPADVDASAQDATDEVPRDACTGFSCLDAAQLDAPITDHALCPDAGYFTVVGDDDDAQTLTSSFEGEPVAYFVYCCGYSALDVVASATRDGGPGMDLERAAFEKPDGGGVTFLANGSIASYYRATGRRSPRIGTTRR